MEQLNLDQTKNTPFLPPHSKIKILHSPHKVDLKNVSTCLELALLSWCYRFSKDKKFKEKLIKQILLNKSECGTWNYWQINSFEKLLRPYPDDLDDTFLSLSALCAVKPKIINPSLWQNVIKILLRNRKAKEIYNTWDNNLPQWQDIDLAVNANIAHFLKSFKIQYPGIENIVDHAIKEKRLESKYYASFFITAYFISRIAPEKNRKQLGDLILHRYQSQEVNFLEECLIASSLLYLDYDVKPIALLLKKITLRKEQRTKAFPFWIDLISNGQKIYRGSGQLTTAFYFEAKALFAKRIKKDEKTKNRQDILNRNRDTFNCVFKKDSPFYNYQPLINNVVTRIIRNDTNCVSGLLPEVVDSICKKDTVGCINKNLILCNCIGWVVYRIFDDNYDRSKDLAMLPLAIGGLRFIYSKMLVNALYYDTAHRLFSEIEESMMAEKNKEAVITENHLSGRSAPILLIPLIILGNKGLSPLMLQQFENIIRTIFASKQLLDDMHDWKEDILHESNTIITQELKYLREKEPKTPCTVANNRLFEQYVLPKYSLRVKKQIKQTKKGLLLFCKELEKEQFSTEKFRKYILEIIEPLEKAAHDALYEQRVVSKILSIG